MKKETRCLVHLICCLLLLVLSLPGIVTAAQEMRTALIIGNSAYSSGPLKNPANDAADMAAMLKDLGFSVTLNENNSLREMDEAIEAFGNRLKKGGVGLFYYAGHGVQVNGTNYLLPIGAKINKEADVKYQAVDANKILDEMATANNGLNIVILDACRDNPFTRSFRNAARGLAIVSSAPSGTFISYSTSPGNVARDGDGRNSPYTAALLQYMPVPGLTISDVFVNVRAKVKKETGQVPWELSSLEGRFYFKPQDSRQNNPSDAPPPAPKMEVASKEKMAFPLPDKPSIAVLPFANMTGDASQEFMVDGLTENIITALARMPQLFVIARNSTFIYKGKGVKVQQVAEELGIQYVLEGSIQRSGDKVRITAQFIDALKGRHLWAAQYDSEMKDLFQLTDEVTRKVLTAVHGKLTGREEAQLRRVKSPKNTETFIKVFEVIAAMRGLNPKDNAQAKRLAEELIEMDPNWSMGPSMLARTHYMDVVLGVSNSPKESLAKALELAQKAVAMDEFSPTNYDTLGYIFSLRGEHERALAEFEKASTLCPSCSDPYMYIGFTQYCMDETNRAIVSLQTALRLNPYPPVYYYLHLGNAYRHVGRYEEAISWFKKSLQISPNVQGVYVGLVSCYSLLGREGEACSAAEELLRVNPKFTVEAWVKSIPYKNQEKVARFADALRKAGLK